MLTHLYKDLGRLRSKYFMLKYSVHRSDVKKITIARGVKETPDMSPKYAKQQFVKLPIHL